MSERRAVTFVADSSPYQRGESASFPAGRAETLVGAGVARYIDDGAGSLAGAAIAADPQAGKRTGQAKHYAKK